MGACNENCNIQVVELLLLHGADVHHANDVFFSFFITIYLREDIEPAFLFECINFFFIF